MEIKVGQVFEVTEEFFKKTNELYAKLMQQFKPGALVEIVEIGEFGNVTAIKFLESNETFFIDTSPVGAYRWCFFTIREANLNQIKLVKDV